MCVTLTKYFLCYMLHVIASNLTSHITLIIGYWWINSKMTTFISCSGAYCFYLYCIVYCIVMVGLHGKILRNYIYQ